MGYMWHYVSYYVFLNKIFEPICLAHLHLLKSHLIQFGQHKFWLLGMLTVSSIYVGQDSTCN